MKYEKLNAPTFDWLISVVPHSITSITVQLFRRDTTEHRRSFWSSAGHSRVTYGRLGKCVLANTETFLHRIALNGTPQSFRQMYYVWALFGNHTLPNARQSWTLGYDGAHPRHNTIQNGSVRKNKFTRRSSQWNWEIATNFSRHEQCSLFYLLMSLSFFGFFFFFIEIKIPSINTILNVHLWLEIRFVCSCLNSFPM